MTNKSKAIGTWTETQVVKHARANGFVGADETSKAQRIQLNGADDQGDVSLCPGVMIEVKGGKSAEAASDARIVAWLADTERERVARGVDTAMLVLKRKGKGATSVGQWWAIMPGHTYVHIATAGQVWEYEHLCPVRVLFSDALLMLRHAGHGARLTVTDEVA